MKKKLLLAILLCLLTSIIAGCSSSPKNFSIDNLTVTLTKEFKEEKSREFDMYIVSDDVVFSAIEETANELETSGYEISSLNDYCLEIAELNSTPKSAIAKRDNYYYFTNTKTVSGGNYTYIHCMFEGQSSYWICEFVCKTKLYDRYKKDIFSWADSIQISR